jgi:hypothetical protein
VTRQSRSGPDLLSACACVSLEVDDTCARTIWHLARWYLAKGWIVRTRLPGWGLPPRVDGHVPALYASDGSSEVAIDVVVVGGAGPAADHRRVFHTWQTRSPASRGYSIEPAHKSAANRVADAPAGAWVDGDGRGFW